jgi:small GTP-binding protein
MLKIKLLVLGEAAVGKTSIIRRFIEGEAFDAAVSRRVTIGVDFSSKLVDNSVVVQVWDTAGEEKYRALTTSYFQRAQGAFLVYDISDRNSFRRIRDWAELLRECAGEQVHATLVANKADLEHRLVSRDEGRELAKELGMDFMETNAISGDNVNEVFARILRLCVQSSKRMLYSERTREITLPIGRQNSKNEWKWENSAKTKNCC